MVKPPRMPVARKAFQWVSPFWPRNTTSAPITKDPTMFTVMTPSGKTGLPNWRMTATPAR